MRLTKEQKFLYTRIATLIASAGWIASAFAGLKGFSFWYGGFVLCFWVAFGLLNYQERTSLWFAVRRRGFFLLFYMALASSLILLDQLALRLHLWFYPFYHGWWFIWVYGVLYPIAAFAQLELFYFLARTVGEKLRFKQHAGTKWHHLVDGAEGILLLLMIFLLFFFSSRYP